MSFNRFSHTRTAINVVELTPRRLHGLIEEYKGKFRGEGKPDIQPICMDEKADTIGYYYNCQTAKTAFPDCYRSWFAVCFIIMGTLDFSKNSELLRTFVNIMFTDLLDEYAAYHYFFGLALGGVLSSPVSLKHCRESKSKFLV